VPYAPWSPISGPTSPSLPQRRHTRYRLPVVRGPPLPLVPAHATEQGHHHALSLGAFRYRVHRGPCGTWECQRG
jgi:hypothetical protein